MLLALWSTQADTVSCSAAAAAAAATAAACLELEKPERERRESGCTYQTRHRKTKLLQSSSRGSRAYSPPLRSMCLVAPVACKCFHHDLRPKACAQRQVYALPKLNTRLHGPYVRKSSAAAFVHMEQHCLWVVKWHMPVRALLDATGSWQDGGALLHVPDA